jgi:PilZ domain
VLCSGGRKALIAQLKSGVAKMCRALTEYRSNARRPYNVALSLCWSDTSGKIVHGVARCVNISDSGARIEYSQPIAKLSPVRISADESRMAKTGRVRYCEPAGSIYLIGIEFR